MKFSRQILFGEILAFLPIYGMVQMVQRSYIDGMPDRQITHDDVVTEGDKVLIRWTMTGTPRKEVVGIPPGDKPVTITGFDLFRISGGKIAEMWQQFGVGKWP
jgi:predicted ester cyclase